MEGLPMSTRSAVRRPVPAVLLLVLAALAALAWFRPAGSAAQDSTPMPPPAGSPQAMAEGTSDCTQPLGLAAGNACVNVIHASPDAPAVDVYVDGQPALQGLAFGAASGFVGLPPGDHQFQVAPAGAPADQAVIDTTLTLEAGTAYEVAAFGPLADIGALVTTANLDPLMGDSARVRVVQTITGAPPADVAAAGGPVLIGNVVEGNASEYAEVPAGATPVDLEIRPAGQGTAIFSIPGAQLQPGLVYSFYALGSVTDPSALRVLPVVAPASGGMMAGTPVAASPVPLAPAQATPAP
jgi:hypothetical protein